MSIEPLTPAQKRVAKLAATTSLSAKEIAAMLGLAVGTVKNHLNEAYTRLDVDDRLGLIMWYRKHCTCPPPIELNE